MPARRAAEVQLSGGGRNLLAAEVSRGGPRSGLRPTRGRAEAARSRERERAEVAAGPVRRWSWAGRLRGPAGVQGGDQGELEFGLEEALDVQGVEVCMRLGRWGWPRRVLAL